MKNKILYGLLTILLVSFGASDGFARREKGNLKGPRVKIEKEIVEKEVIREVPGAITVNIFACTQEYTKQTIVHCDTRNSCLDSSTIEVLMAIDPQMSAECKKLPYNSKLAAIEEGFAVHRRCTDAGGLYNMTLDKCEFTIELRKKNKDKVFATATVVEGQTNTCGKELFPAYSKKRNRQIAGWGLLGASVGAVGGGMLTKHVLGIKRKIKKVLRNDCGISNQTAVDTIANKIYSKDQETVYPNLMDDLQKTGGLTYDEAVLCVTHLNKKIKEAELVAETRKMQVHIDREREKFTVIMPGPVMFDYNKATLTADGREGLDQVVSMLQSTTEPVTIDGYASKDGPEDSNRRLSQRRANTVKKYLQDNGISNPIQSTGHGEVEIFGNDLESNRRVIIKGPIVGTGEFDNPHRTDTEQKLDLDVHIKKKRFGKFLPGAIIGGVTGGALGAGIAALASKKKLKCYHQGEKEILADWKEQFTVVPPTLEEVIKLYELKFKEGQNTVDIVK